MKIGILALQGAFAEHKKAFSRLGIDTVLIRQAFHFDSTLDGLVLPGGESTVQGKLLTELGLMCPIREAITAGMPVFGTCAGMILLAKTINNDHHVYLGTMDITVCRNAYGRQLGSFATELDMAGIGHYPAIFIRAPYIVEVGRLVTALATVDGRIVAARQNNMLATAFHPELTDDLRVHEYFARMIQKHS